MRQTSSQHVGAPLPKHDARYLEVPDSEISFYFFSLDVQRSSGTKSLYHIELSSAQSHGLQHKLELLHFIFPYREWQDGHLRYLGAPAVACFRIRTSGIRSEERTRKDAFQPREWVVFPKEKELAKAIKSSERKASFQRTLPMGLMSKVLTLDYQLQRLRERYLIHIDKTFRNAED